MAWRIYAIWRSKRGQAACKYSLSMLTSYPHLLPVAFHFHSGSKRILMKVRSLGGDFRLCTPPINCDRLSCCITFATSKIWPVMATASVGSLCFILRTGCRSSHCFHYSWLSSTFPCAWLFFSSNLSFPLFTNTRYSTISNPLSSSSTFPHTASSPRLCLILPLGPRKSMSSTVKRW